MGVWMGLFSEFFFVEMSLKGGTDDMGDLESDDR